MTGADGRYLEMVRAVAPDFIDAITTFASKSATDNATALATSRVDEDNLLCEFTLNFQSGTNIGKPLHSTSYSVIMKSTHQCMHFQKVLLLI